jgi:hypothetical protein
MKDVKIENKKSEFESVVGLERKTGESLAKNENISKYRRLSLDTGTFLIVSQIEGYEIMADEYGRLFLIRIEDKNRIERMYDWLTK